MSAEAPPPIVMSWDLREGESLALLAALPDGEVDAVITDPPYSSGGAFRGDRTQSLPSNKYVSSGTRNVGPDFTGDNRDQRSFGYWCALWLAEARRVSRPGAVLAVFSDWRQLPTVTDAVQAGGWVWRGIAVWRKPHHQSRPTKGGFWNQSEFVVWGTNGPHTPAADAPCLPGVIDAEAPRGADRVHITEKPVGLLDVMVQVAPVDGLVLDPFAGSGTTGVAAVRHGRRFLGFEMVPAIAEIARQRLAGAAGDWDQLGTDDTPSLFSAGEQAPREDT